MSSWIQPMIERLRALWDDGHSASQCARMLSGEFRVMVSRNSILSKVHRSGMATRANGQQRRPSRLTAPRATTPKSTVKAPYVPPPPIIEEPALVLDDGSHVTVMTLTGAHCRFPLGDPLEVDFHFCGRAHKPGSPYCPFHHRVAFQALPTKRGKPAQETNREAIISTGRARVFGL